MKAIQFHEFGPESVLRYEDVVKPQPKPGEILVRVAATAVNALDVKLRAGVLRGFMDYPLPLILGSDVAGTVEGGGDNFKPGQRVFGMPAIAVGMYADYAVLKSYELALLPDEIEFAAAASFPTVALTAWQALFEVGQLSRGQKILIHGASGGVGSMAVQLARNAGAHVTAVASTEKVEFVRRLGADEVIDYKSERFEDKAKGMDLVLDVLSGETRKRSWTTLRKGGRLVSTVPPFPTAEEAAPFEVTGHGIAVHPDSAGLSKIAELVLRGSLKATIDRTLPLRDAAEAHRLMQTGKVQGKIVLVTEANTAGMVAR